LRKKGWSKNKIKIIGSKSTRARTREQTTKTILGGGGW
jgi:hypothetical protein